MRYEFAFGIGFDAAGVPLAPHDVREWTKIVLVEACRLFGGCNILNGQGAWIDPAGNLVVEESRVLVVDTTSAGRYAEEYEADAKRLADFVRRTFRQHSVHFTRIVSTAVNVEAVAVV